MKIVICLVGLFTLTNCIFLGIHRDLQTLKCQNKRCPRIYDPVCIQEASGTIKTYSSLCVFEIAHCSKIQNYKVLYYSKCPSMLNIGSWQCFKKPLL